MPKQQTQKSTSAASAKSVLAATARLKPRWSTSKNRVLKSRRKRSAFRELSFHGNEKVHADHVTPAMAMAAIVASTTVQKRVAFELSKRKSTLALNASTHGPPMHRDPVTVLVMRAVPRRMAAGKQPPRSSIMNFRCRHGCKKMQAMWVLPSCGQQNCSPLKSKLVLRGRHSHVDTRPT